MAAAIRLYLDENVPVVIAPQLRRKGIDVVTVRDLGRLGDSDENHLARATAIRTKSQAFWVAAARSSE